MQQLLLPARAKPRMLYKHCGASVGNHNHVKETVVNENAATIASVAPNDCSILRSSDIHQYPKAMVNMALSTILINTVYLISIFWIKLPKTNIVTNATNLKLANTKPHSETEHSSYQWFPGRTAPIPIWKWRNKSAQSRRRSILSNRKWWTT